METYFLRGALFVCKQYVNLAKQRGLTYHIITIRFKKEEMIL